MYKIRMLLLYCTYIIKGIDATASLKLQWFAMLPDGSLYKGVRTLLLN